MTFKNEYIPPLEQETSAFLKEARVILRTGHSQFDSWTVDRENDRVLDRTGCGHEIEDHDQESWVFLDGSRRYSFYTRQSDYRLVDAGPPQKIALTRDILSFWAGDDYAGLPDDRTIRLIKEAFQVFGAYCMASADREVEQTLLWNGARIGT